MCSLDERFCAARKGGGERDLGVDARGGCHWLGAQGGRNVRRNEADGGFGAERIDGVALSAVLLSSRGIELLRELQEGCIAQMTGGR